MEQQRHDHQAANITAVMISLLIGAIIGYFIGTLTTDSQVSESIQGAVDRGGESFREATNNEESLPNSNPTQSGEVDSTLVAGDADEVAFTIPLDRLSTEQRTGLRLMGIDGEELVITKGTLACAEAEMGAERLVEIQNGASVTMSEGMTLASCYSTS